MRTRAVTRAVSTIECSACYNVRSFLVGRTFAERFACAVARLWVHLSPSVVSILAGPRHYGAAERPGQLEVSHVAVGRHSFDASGDDSGLGSNRLRAAGNDRLAALALSPMGPVRFRDDVPGVLRIKLFVRGRTSI